MRTQREQRTQSALAFVLIAGLALTTSAQHASHSGLVTFGTLPVPGATVTAVGGGGKEIVTT